MRHALQVTASLTVAGLLSCVPVPMRTTPHIAGTIRRADTPLPHVRVEWLSWNGVEFVPVASATTDARGRIEIAEQRSWQWQPLMGDRLVKWRCQLHEGHQTIPLWEQARVGSEPTGVVLDCDLGHERPCVLTASADPRLPADGKRLPTKSGTE